MYQYANGNTTVSIYRDGTKTREWEGDASPVFPESIDLKITDYCDAGCAYCHEQSTRRGAHARAGDILRIVDGLPSGSEIAIGGGNPLSHPDLFFVLRKMRSAGLVTNLTVNAVHLRRFADDIALLRRESLVYGLGISYHPAHETAIVEVADANTVLHVIAGVHGVSRFMSGSSQLPSKMLVLGYKRHGFGLKFYDRGVEPNIAAWRYWIGTLMRRGQYHVSFDNLAIRQLAIRDRVTPEKWGASYMGDDGQFTMYVDAVRMEFAVSSTSRERQAIAGKDIREMFAAI